MSDTAELAARLEKLIRANRTNGQQVAPQFRESAREWAQSLSLVSLSSAITPAGGAASEEAPALPRVLVIEPDVFHRQVLSRVLENLGYAVDSTGNAAEATTAFEHRRYAVVLLDCDGGEAGALETASALRRIEKSAVRIPIIALSSRGHAAGLDGFIAKPILRAKLAAVLTRHAPARPHEAIETWSYLALDRRRLGELDEAAGGRADLLAGWIALFLAGAADLLAQMRTAQEQGDSDALSKAAMQLGSRGGQVGALRVQEICGIVVRLAASGRLAGVEALLPDLAMALARATGELEALAGKVRRGLHLARPPSRVSSDDHAALLAVADPLVAGFLANSLTAGGFQVTQAPGGSKALEATREMEFAVVILDPDVPEDGYAVLSEIRSRPGATTPVMIVSPRREEEDILRAFDLGADDYVTIPFRPPEVVARVRRLVKQGAHVR